MKKNYKKFNVTFPAFFRIRMYNQYNKAMNELLTIERITEMQKAYGVTGTQAGINSGQCWLMEGSVGRFASDMLEAGVCMLPDERKQDYYGSTVPSCDDLKPGTKGTLLNSQNFWQRVEDNDYEAIVGLEETFGVQSEQETTEQE